MPLRYSYRLYPTPVQQQALARLFGCVRVVFNDGLRTREQAYEAGRPYPTDSELSARLTASKATPERAWLGEVSAVPLQQSLADLNLAYQRFFASRMALRDWQAAGRKGARPRAVGPPRFKSHASAPALLSTQAIATEQFVASSGPVSHPRMRHENAPTGCHPPQGPRPLAPSGLTPWVLRVPKARAEEAGSHR